MPIEVPTILKKSHAGHYNVAMGFLEVAMESEAFSVKQIALLNAQANATLAIYKFLLEEKEEERERKIKTNELWIEAFKSV